MVLERVDVWLVVFCMTWSGCRCHRSNMPEQVTFRHRQPFAARVCLKHRNL